MPPPGYEPFMRAICADPEDDTARLVYADWLDENGDPERAEFIRLQIANSGLLKKDDPNGLRIEELLQQHGTTWINELPQLPGIGWPRTFHRGFGEAVSVTSDRGFIEHRKQIFLSAPGRLLSVSEAGEATLRRLLVVREIERITGLCLQRCRVPNGRLEVLTHCPRLANLRWLAMGGRNSGQRRVDLTEEEAREFVATPFLPNLDAIYFRDWISHETKQLLLTRFKTVVSHCWICSTRPPHSLLP